MRKPRVSCVILGLFSLALTGANAGELNVYPEGAATYTFTECAEPTAPDVTEKDFAKASKSRRTRNNLARAHNDYVGKLNAWFTCLSEEAGRDVQIYYNAVNASLAARQQMAINRAEEMRRALNLKTDPLESELLGGEPVSAAPETPSATDELLGGPGE
jgi:hypothetical protein